jgi:hypothetical protein
MAPARDLHDAGAAAKAGAFLIQQGMTTHAW